MEKEGKLKNKQNRAFQNNDRKFDQQVGGENTRTNQIPDAKETKQFWSEIWKRKKYYLVLEWVNKMKKIFRGTQRRPRGEHKSGLAKSNTQKITNWKAPNGIY